MPVTQEARVQFPTSANIQLFFLLLLQFWPLKMILTTKVYQLENNPLGCTARPRDTRFLVPEKDRAAQNRTS